MAGRPPTIPFYFGTCQGYTKSGRRCPQPHRRHRKKLACTAYPDPDPDTIGLDPLDARLLPASTARRRRPSRRSHLPSPRPTAPRRLSRPTAFLGGTASGRPGRPPLPSCCRWMLSASHAYCTQFIPRVLRLAHDDPTAGHLGPQKTLRRVLDRF